MKNKKLIWITGIVVALGIAGFLFYKMYLPQLIAQVILKPDNSVTGIVPEKISRKLDALRTPINKGSEEFVTAIHGTHITMDHIISAIDNMDDEEFYGIMEDLTSENQETSQQVFNTITKHMTFDFDVEELREPFCNIVNVDLVNSTLNGLKGNSGIDDVDVDMVKSVLKAILIEKEKEIFGEDGMIAS